MSEEAAPLGAETVADHAQCHRPWQLKGRTIVVLGSFCEYDWAWLHQRQQQIVERLTGLGRVVYVERHGARPASAWAIVRALVKRFVASAPTSCHSVKSIRFVRVPVVPLHGVAVIDRINARMLEKRLRSVIPHPLEESTAVVFYPSPYVIALLRRVPFETVIHDAAQRYGETPEVYGRDAGLIDRQLAAMADVATCDSVTIEADRLGDGILCWRMPQGCDSARLSREGPSLIAVSISAARGEGPILGFVGALGEVIDWASIEACASVMPNAHIALVGPVVVPPPTPLPPNVTLYGWAGSGEMGSIIRAFDVGMIPYLVNTRTEAVCPTKLPEYLACGCPVVATPLPDIQAMKEELPEGLIEVGVTPVEFAEAALRQASRARLSTLEMEAVTSQYEWDALVRQWISHIEDVRTHRKPAVLLVGLGYVPGRTHSDKNFMRDVAGYVRNGPLQPIVVSGAEAVMTFRDHLGAVPVYVLPQRISVRPRHERAEGDIRVLSRRKSHALTEYAQRTFLCLRLRSTIRWARKRHQVAHVHFFDNLGPMTRFACGSGVGVSTTMISSTGSWRNPLRRALWRASFRAVDTVFATSDDLAMALRRTSGVRTVVVPWGCAECGEADESDKRLVVFSGPLQGIGIAELRLAVDAMEIAASAIPSAEMRVWPKPGYVASFARAVRGRIAIESLGPEFDRRLPQVRVLVTPSTSADAIVGPPLTWLEIVRAGGRVVTTPCMGLPSALEKSSSIIVAEGRNPTSLAEAIVTAWNAPAGPRAAVTTSREASTAYEHAWLELIRNG